MIFEILGAFNEKQRKQQKAKFLLAQQILASSVSTEFIYNTRLSIILGEKKNLHDFMQVFEFYCVKLNLHHTMLQEAM